MYAPQQYGQQAQYGQQQPAQWTAQQQQQYYQPQMPQQQQYYQQPQMQQQPQQYYQQPQMQQPQYYQQPQQQYQQPQQYQQEYAVPAPAPYVNTTYSTTGFDASPAAQSGGYEVLSRNVVVVPSPGAEGAAPAAASTPRVGEVIGRTVTVNDAMQKLLSQMDQQAKLQAHMKGQQDAWLKDPTAVSAKTVAQQQQPTVSAPVNMQLRTEAVARTNTAAKDFVSDMKAGLF